MLVHQGVLLSGSAIGPHGGHFLQGGHQAPPVNRTNILATQEVHLFNEKGCQGPSTKFTSSANSFLEGFEPYVRNLWSVRLCGKGTFFWFSTPDMQKGSTLGYVQRCGNKITSTTKSCTCANLSDEFAAKLES